MKLGDTFTSFEAFESCFTVYFHARRLCRKTFPCFGLCAIEKGQKCFKIGSKTANSKKFNSRATTVL